MSETNKFEGEPGTESEDLEIVEKGTEVEGDGEITSEQIKKNYEEAVAAMEKDPLATPEGIEANKGILEAAKDYLMEIIKDHPGAVLVAGGLVYVAGLKIGLSASTKLLDVALGAEIETIVIHDVIQILLGGMIMNQGRDIFNKGREYWDEKHNKSLFSMSILGHEYSI